MKKLLQKMVATMFRSTCNADSKAELCPVVVACKVARKKRGKLQFYAYEK